MQSFYSDEYNVSNKIFIYVLFWSVVTIVGDSSCLPSNISYTLCMSSENNLTVISKPFNAIEFLEECHRHFVEEILGENCDHSNDSITIPQHISVPTTAQRYGYGFLAVLTISILSMAGLCVFPLINKTAFPYILVLFTALAVGTLLGDSIFHLIPFALGLHAHDNDADHEDSHNHDTRADENHNHATLIIPDYQWKMLLAILILYAFYLLEVLLHSLAHHKHKHNSVDRKAFGHSHSNSSRVLSVSVINDDQNKSVDIDLDHSHQHHNHMHHNMHQHSAKEMDNNVEKSSFCGEKSVVNKQKTIKYTGYMVLIGDSIHNLADGLAIGAAFSQNLFLGLTTTIAIGCHELPHELGDYAILIQSGFTHVRALLWNFLSATTAIIGFFIGAAVSTNENARQWIFAMTIGMFLYIALTDLLPTLINNEQFEWKQLICVNIGFLLGIFLMFILAIFEEKLVQASS